MALKSVFAFSVLLVFTYGEGKPHNCSETRCKLLPVGEGFASEFRSKASEKGVRLVYLNLKIGNDSYDPLELQDEFLPHRWVWANNITEPMLTLPDDYDILSFGLLNHQVRSMGVQLEDQPSGCLANLNSTCQNMAVGRMLLENVTTGSSDALSHKRQVVCVTVIKTIEHNEIDGYHCCRKNKGPNGPSILCDSTVANNKWEDVIDRIIITLTAFVLFFIPAFPLALPDCFFSLQNECEKEKQQNFTGTPDQQNNRQTETKPLLSYPNNVGGFADNTDREEPNHVRNGYNQRKEESKLIPVDDSSPVTFSTLSLRFVETLPDLGLSFNIKLAIMWLCIYPCVFYVQLGLYRTLKKTQINESIKKHVSVFDVFNRLLLIVTFDGVDKSLDIFLAVVLAFSSFIPVLFSRPKDFILKEGIICCMCEKYSEGNTSIFPSSDRRSVGDEIRRHLKILHHRLCDLILIVKELAVCDCFGPCTCREMREASRLMHAICVLLRLVSFPITLFLRVLCGAIILSVFSFILPAVIFWHSPFMTIFVFFYLKFLQLCDDLENVPLYAIVLILLGIVLVSYFAVLIVAYAITLFSWCNFILNALVYLIMGVVLNVRILTPVVAFFLVVTANIYLCYANMQNKYKDVKKMILKWRKEFQINSSDPDGTIRTQLFWFVCDRVKNLQRNVWLTGQLSGKPYISL